MSSSIKNTLFRFVSMRAPELITDTRTKLGFIYPDKTPDGNPKPHFEAAVNDRTEGVKKLEALKTASINFTPFKLDAIKTLNPNLYDFSVWLAKNRRKTDDAEVQVKINGVAGLGVDLTDVWQNLYYQVITQEDFYTKETLMQLLIADHVIKNSDSGQMTVLLNAKVVLPKSLFIEDEVEPSANKFSKDKEAVEVEFGNFAMQKSEIRYVLEEDNKAYQKLKRELLRVEKIYNQEFQDEYAIQREAYDALHKPALDKYLEDIQNAKVSWCATRDPNVPYNPKDPCHQPPPIKRPEIPKFEFTFKNEFDPKDLQYKLSKESMAVLNALRDPTNTTKLAQFEIQRSVLENTFDSYEFNSFKNAYNGIDRLIDGNNTGSQQNMIDDSVSYVIFGTTPIATVNNASGLGPFAYELKVNTSGIYNNSNTLNLAVGIPNDSWRVASVNFKLTKNDDSFSNHSSTDVLHAQSFDLIPEISMGNIMENLKQASATVNFVNGQQKSLSINNFLLKSIYKGILTSRIIPDENPGNGNSIDPKQTFIPTGFGVKQLGIADYNKVEQSIQGYVEGEVAQIENIMAREFKEKSTRRLRRQENTFTESSETEREKLTDTTAVDRFEMQSEVSNVIANSQDLGISAGVQYSPTDMLTMSTNGSMATHNSNEESTLQAITNAKEITERALDRIVTKVKEERIEKIVEEFEENNTHGFDNRKGDKHVVGVYRWVDKIFKNQIYNYGKRLMFEFMVPEPAKLHKLALDTWSNLNKLDPPVDPRMSNTHKLENFGQLDDLRLKYWTATYPVELDLKPKKYINIGKSFHFQAPTVEDNLHEFVAESYQLEIPEGYETIEARAIARTTGDNFPGYFSDAKPLAGNKLLNENFTSIEMFRDKVPVSYSQLGYLASSINFTLKCELTSEAEAKWQQKTFNAIINAYEDALADYEQKLAEQMALGVQMLGSNPGFYREIENSILRKNCISYLIDQDQTAALTFGKNHFNGVDTFGDNEVKLTKSLDDYAAFVKFMEQAFEWNIMSYHFYPYYWADRASWIQMYQYNDTNDHTFKAFMQSGMARVIVTVRPGFEEAVRYYMQTGQIWNGGEVPVIEDELYLSIIDELRAPEGEKLGKAWWSRVPTALTILQAKSIGLVVDRALPYDENLDDFEDPDSVPQSSQIKELNAQIGGSLNNGSSRLFGTITGNNNIEAKIVLKRIDGSILNLTYTNTNGNWELNNLPEGRFELLLDYDDDFPSDTYEVTVGSKEQVVDLEDGQIVEVNLTVATI